MLDSALFETDLKSDVYNVRSIVHYSHLDKRQLNRTRRKFLRFAALIVTTSVVLFGIIFFVANNGNGSFLNQILPFKLSFLTPDATSLTTVPIGHDYGIAAGGSLTDFNDQELQKAISQIAALGVKWIRFDFNWSLIQPDNSTTYDWSKYDKIVQISQSHGLHVLGILDFTPQWARSSACPDSDKCHPASSQQFATFAIAAAHRYKAMGLHYWEIWNEANSPQFWQPGANAEAYTQLLQTTYKALHKEDSAAYVITAGLSPQASTSTSLSPIDFLAGIYRAGAKGYFEGIADHPYTFPQSPSSKVDHAWNQMANATSSLRQLMVKNGDSNKKMWITEFGAPTNGPDPQWFVSEPKQAALLTDALNLYKSYDWVGPFFWYSYKDAGTTTDTNENFFGLIRGDDSQKPAYTVLQHAAQTSATEK